MRECNTRALCTAHTWHVILARGKRLKVALARARAYTSAAEHTASAQSKESPSASPRHWVTAHTATRRYVRSFPSVSLSVRARCCVHHRGGIMRELLSAAARAGRGCRLQEGLRLGEKRGGAAYLEDHGGGNFATTCSSLQRDRVTIE